MKKHLVISHAFQSYFGNPWYRGLHKNTGLRFLRFCSLAKKGLAENEIKKAIKEAEKLKNTIVKQLKNRGNVDMSDVNIKIYYNGNCVYIQIESPETEIEELPLAYARGFPPRNPRPPAPRRKHPEFTQTPNSAHRLCVITDITTGNTTEVRDDQLKAIMKALNELFPD